MRFARSYIAMILVTVTAVSGCNGGSTTSAGLASPTAPTATGADTSTPAAASEQDRIWLREIHQGNRTEIRAGRLGTRKGSDEVKKIGEMLVKDHTELDKEVTQAAERLGVQLPKKITAEQKKAIAGLRDASRSGFDKAFLAAMRTAHEEAVKATRTEIEKGSSPDVKQLAEKALPRLERHLQEIAKVSGTPVPGSGSPTAGDSPAPGSGTPAPGSPSPESS